MNRRYNKYLFDIKKIHDNLLLLNETSSKNEKIYLVHAVIQSILNNRDLLRTPCIYNSIYTKFDEFERYGIDIKNYKKYFDSILEKF
jgi:hypothetical protein